MCNRARNRAEPEAENWFGDGLLTERPRDNRFNPVELVSCGRAYVVREEHGRRGVDVTGRNVLGDGAAWPMTNVRSLALPQRRRVAENPANRGLVPLTEFCEWTAEKHDVGGGKPVKGGMWFPVTDQPVFAVAGFWQETARVWVHDGDLRRQRAGRAGASQGDDHRPCARASRSMADLGL